jgi:glycosyltransferase involved in cell wall biosynthesis
MKILMISLADAVFRAGEGGGNTAERLSEYLDAARQIEPGSSITALVFTPGSFRPLTPRPGLTFIPVQAPRVQLFPMLGLWKALRLRPRLAPDVVTTQNSYEAGLLGLLLARRFEARLEVQIHFDLLSPYWLQEHPVWNRVRQGIAQRTLTRADAIRVVSSPLKEGVVERWGIPRERVAVIPVPVAFEVSRAAEGFSVRPSVLSDPTSKIVLYVGRLCHQKNLPGLFAIIEKILDARADTEVILLGDGPQRAYAEERAAALGEEQVHVMGNVPYHNLPHYYETADVLILPSLYEGFGRVVMESYLFDTPAVATTCSGPEDIILDEETGFLTAIEDLDRFTDRVLWLLAHPESAREMGRRGNRYVRETFDPQRLVDDMVGQWWQLAKRDRQP